MRKTFLTALSVILFLFVSCSKDDSEKASVTVHLRNQSGTSVTNQLVYEFSYTSSHLFGSNTQYANYVRETDKSGNAIFEVNDYELTNGLDKGVVFFTVFRKDSTVWVTDSLVLEKEKRVIPRNLL